MTGFPTPFLGATDRAWLRTLECDLETEEVFLFWVVGRSPSLERVVTRSSDLHFLPGVELDAGLAAPSPNIGV